MTAFPSSHTHAASPCARVLIRCKCFGKIFRVFNSCHTEGLGGQGVFVARLLFVWCHVGWLSAWVGLRQVRAVGSMLLVPSVSDVASTASCGTRSPGCGRGRQPLCYLFWNLTGSKLGSHLAVPKEHLPCAVEKEACGFGLPLCFLEGIHEACVLSDRCVSAWRALRVPSTPSVPLPAEVVTPEAH